MAQFATKEDPIQDVAALEDILSEPTQDTIDAMGSLEGDIVILGVGGKMGPTLARMAKRASDLAGVSRRVIGVSRFSTSTLPDKLHSWGVETHQCDLLDLKSYSQLPDAPNIVYMARNEIRLDGSSVTDLGHERYPARTGEREISQ